MLWNNYLRDNLYNQYIVKCVKYSAPLVSNDINLFLFGYVWHSPLLCVTVKLQRPNEWEKNGWMCMY